MNSLIKELINKHIQKFQEIEDYEDFYFQKAVEALKNWIDFSISNDELNRIISTKYEDFLNDSSLKEVRDCLFTLIAYCDVNARDKDKYNEYENNRTIAHAGIRQNAWVVQLCKYKLDKQGVTTAVASMIDYINNPSNKLPIISEDHKESISKFFLNKPYDSSTFDSEIISHFADYITCKNKDNLSYAIMRIIYEEKKQWLKHPIMGLVEQQQETNKTMDNLINLLQTKKNIILQGAPGTGKTYTTASLAVSLCNKDFADFSDHTEVMEEYERLKELHQIEFCTFHQSVDYEDFVEGLKPKLQDSGVTYEVEDGIFKRICKNANEMDDVVDNFEESLSKLIQLFDTVDYVDIPLISDSSKYIRIELNEDGDGLANRTYEDDIFEKDNWIRGKSKFFNFDQLYNIYKGKQGTPKGGHDNYRKAIVRYMIDNLGLKEYKEGTTNTQKNYVLIIDEINRGNVSKIFGELITLLEADKRLGEKHPISVTLPYSKEPFSVPSNLYIIGTMNTTDRSTGTIDYAVRRRFAFVTLETNKEIVKNHYTDTDLQTRAVGLFNEINNVFIPAHKSSDFELEDLKVGHSYFMADSLDTLKLKMQYEVVPLIKEYIKDGILQGKDDDKKYFDAWIVGECHKKNNGPADIPAEESREE